MSFRRGLQLAGFARRHLGRMARGRREVMAHLAAPRPENLPMPTFVQLRVTNLCNLRCKMCGQWGDTGIYRSDGFSASATDGESERDRIRELIGLNRQLALSDYVRLLDEIAPWKPIVSLFGGEPLLYPDILPLVREVKKRGLTCTVITNGGRLEPYAKELVEAGIDSIAVSIDGPPEVHDRIRGKGGQLPEGRGGRAGRGDVAREARPAGADADRDPAGHGAEPRIDRARRRSAARAAARHDQRRPALVRARGKREPSTSRVMREHVRRLGRFLEGLRLRLVQGRRLEDAADDRPREAPQGSEAPPLPRLGGGEALGLVRPRRARPKRCPSTSPTSPRPSATTCAPSPGTSPRSSPTARSASAGTFPTTSSATCASSRSATIWTGEKAWKFREKLAKEPLPICARCCGNYVYGKWERPPLAANSEKPDEPVGPEPVEVEPLRRVVADHALEVRGDAAHHAGGVFLGGGRGIGVEGLAPDVVVRPVRAAQEEARQDRAAAETGEQGGGAQEGRRAAEERHGRPCPPGRPGRRASRRPGRRRSPCGRGRRWTWSCRCRSTRRRRGRAAAGASPERAARARAGRRPRASGRGGAASRRPSPSCRRGR